MKAQRWTESDEEWAEYERRLLTQGDCEAPPMLYRLPQPWLWRRNAEEAFRGLGLTRADVAAWHENGWLPTDLSQATLLEEEDYCILKRVWQLAQHPKFRKMLAAVLFLDRLPPQPRPYRWPDDRPEWSVFEIPPEDQDDVLPGLFDERARRARRLLWYVQDPDLRQRLRAIGYGDLVPKPLSAMPSPERQSTS